jgi:hypothetical protein
MGDLIAILYTDMDAPLSTYLEERFFKSDSKDRISFEPNRIESESEDPNFYFFSLEEERIKENFEYFFANGEFKDISLYTEGNIKSDCCALCENYQDQENQRTLIPQGNSTIVGESVNVCYACLASMAKIFYHESVRDRTLTLSLFSDNCCESGEPFMVSNDLAKLRIIKGTFGRHYSDETLYPEYKGEVYLKSAPCSDCQREMIEWDVRNEGYKYSSKEAKARLLVCHSCSANRSERDDYDDLPWDTREDKRKAVLELDTSPGMEDYIMEEKISQWENSEIRILRALRIEDDPLLGVIFYVVNYPIDSRSVEKIMTFDIVRFSVVYPNTAPKIEDIETPVSCYDREHSIYDIIDLGKSIAQQFSSFCIRLLGDKSIILESIF